MHVSAKTRFSYFLMPCGILLAIFSIVNIIGHAFLLEGLHRYYGLHKSQILCVGHSMSAMGIDKCLLEKQTGKKVSKYTMSGVGICERRIMLNQYVETTNSFPDIVVYDVSARIFSNGLSENAYALFYPFLEESPSIDRMIRGEASYGEYLRKKLIPLTRYEDLSVAEAVRGWRGDWTNRTIKRFDHVAFEKRFAEGLFWHISFEENAMLEFDETLKWLNDNGCEVILACLPSVDILNALEPDKHSQAMSLLQNYSLKYAHVHLLDLNGEFSQNYALFADPIHLNPYGQIIITKELAKYINGL